MGLYEESLKMHEIYLRVAESLSEHVRQIFGDNDSLSRFFYEDMGMSTNSGIEVDRTDGWDIRLRNLFEMVWKNKGPEVKTSSTGYDRLSVLRLIAKNDLLDYNLFTQVAMNLIPHTGYTYDLAAAAHAAVEIIQKWDKYPPAVAKPHDPKAKMVKSPTTDADYAFNQDLSTIKALNIIQKRSLSTSFRVSAAGSTPAFADSNNLSMLGMGADAFMRIAPGYKLFYLTWAAAPRMVSLDIATGAFHAQGCSYPFFSKSGGDTLNDVLFTRKVAYLLYKSVLSDATSYIDILPRMNSVMLLTTQTELDAELIQQLKAACSSLVITEGSRPAH
jgi:hypothetical protein